MLPDRIIELKRLDDQTLAPSWLSQRDEVWLRPFCDEMEAFAGRRVAGVESRVRALADEISRQHGIAARRVDGVWLVERRRWRKYTEAPVDPQRIRAVVFDLAPRHPRDEALARAGCILGIDPLSIRRHLFADRDDERVFLPPDDAPNPRLLVDAYNLALAQALLMRAISVRARVRSDARHVLSYAKALGLMLSFHASDEAIVLELSGPLALFHATTKYGFAMARFLPALASTVGWSVVAEVQLRGERHILRLSSEDPLPRTHPLPRSFDSKIERRLAVDLRRLGPERGWRLERESVVVSTGVGGQLFYPDFTLYSEGGGRVLVEVVGFWTPEYLAKKQRALAAVHEPIVVCVDERHATELGVPTSDSAVVVTFRERIDAQALLAAAERALEPRTEPDIFAGLAEDVSTLAGDGESGVPSQT